MIVQEFSDSGIFGAEFANRPGLNALLDAATAKKRDFTGLVIRDVDRLGRDQFRTAMALQDLVEHGVRVFCYGVNDGEEIKLGSFADKIMLSIRTGSADDFCDKVGRLPWSNASSRWARRALATGASPTRWRLNRFRLLAAWVGRRRSSARCSRTAYVDKIALGRTCADAVGGQANRRAVVTDESKWTVVKQPGLRIISDKVWTQVQKRRAATLERYGSHRSADGKLHGRPEAGLIAAHLLNGFAVCGVCGGSLTFMSKNGRTSRYYCQRRNSRGSTPARTPRVSRRRSWTRLSSARCTR